MHLSVIYHTPQCETSHVPHFPACGSFLTMTEGETFQKNLLAALEISGMSEAELSLKAGLNRRAVTDLREGRVRSPKLSTVFALSKALGRDPAEMMGLGSRLRVRSDLAEFLSEFDEADQERFLNVLSAVTGRSDESPK